MSAKEKHTRNIINRYTVGALVVLVVGTVAATALVFKHNTQATPSSQKTSQLPQRAPGDPQFSLDIAAAPGWRQGPTDKNGMAAFYEAHGCFVAIERKQGTVDVQQELKKNRDTLASTNNTRTPLGTVDMTLQTSAGQQEYELHQYSASGEDIKGGMELGYLQLANGYIEIEGYCDTADDLPATIPALEAIKFEAAD